MRPTLAAGTVVVGLATIQFLLSRWFPFTSIPFILSVLLAAAFVFPHARLVRLTLLGALAAELGSGLPVGLAFAGAFFAPHLLLAVLRRPRPELPGSVRGVVSGSVIVLLFGAAHAAGLSRGDLRTDMVFNFLGLRVLLPSILTGALAIVMGSLLRHPATERMLLRPLGITRA